MVKILQQSTNEYAPPPPPPFHSVEMWQYTGYAHPLSGVYVRPAPAPLSLGRWFHVAPVSDVFGAPSGKASVCIFILRS